MSTLLAEPDRASTVVGKYDEKLGACARLIMNSSDSVTGLADRRHDRRIAYPYAVELFPADEELHLENPVEPIVVLGKHLSERGLDFYCRHPLEHRRAIAAFEYADGQRLAFLLALTWCRFNRHGWYENGGRFLQVISDPTETYI